MDNKKNLYFHVFTGICDSNEYTDIHTQTVQTTKKSPKHETS